ncbi:TonB-dependent receptor [Cytophagaceae bacterium DM2B3-1]|uniref:TonB-dependent receptor n=2 Tax=Xanthocytophaga flava TaxID=3048013 RepID=A0ABT7CNL7_9BACT|nr:TonB-dependent receptor [Xanthocytophaga flavus]MDJ1495317.1 TonB-dependent receptor [Xanthocytophaga flavus]
MHFSLHPSLLWIIMRITVIQLLIAICFASIASATDSKAQSVLEQKVSIHVENQTVESVLARIEKQANVRFSYQTNVFASRERITLSVTDEQLSTLLNKILLPLQVYYEAINDKRIILHKQPSGSSLIEQSDDMLAEAAHVVSGKVTDENNAGIPGVSVSVKGTTVGTSTDKDGNYTLSAPDGSGTLVFSFIGYATEEIAIGNRTSVNITLVPDIKALNEVVVVGYGTQKKIDVTGAVANVSGEELLKAPVNNALQGLQGKVAGVNIFLNSGSPTGSPRVVIRGAGSINSTLSPLYVVDGVVMEDIRFLNPNDIESIDVLKDASSAAIYGARGANGVILVTTKRGTKKEGISVGYDGYISIGQLRKKMDLLNAKEWMEVVKTGMEHTSKYRPGQTATFTANDPRLFDANGNPLYDTDWQKEATRTAVSYNHQISIQQGGQNSSFGAFLNYSRMEGIMLNSWLNRLNGKIAFDANPKKWLSIGMNVLANYTVENEAEEGGGHQMPRRTMIEMPPIFPVKFPDGTWSNSSMVTDDYRLEGMANPVHVLETQERGRKRTQLFGNLFTTFHILPGLDLRTQFGFDKHNRNFQEYYPTDLLNISSPLGRAYLETQQVNYWQEETYLTYNKTLAEVHRVNAMLGLSWQERTYQQNSIQAEGFSDNFFKYNRIQAASKPGAPNSDFDKWAMNSYFVRAGYTYADKYLVTLTGRVDGSSRFGANNKYGFFPSLGVGWVLSNEPFLQGLSSIDELKLRSSIGVTGNTEIPSYGSLATVASGTVLINGNRASDSYVTRLANPNLKWERTRTFDVGVNLSMFKSRLSVELDYYHKLTTDLLLDRPVPHTTGFQTVRDNIGSVSNRGFEVLLTGAIVRGGKFSWQSSLNFNYNKNRIEKLGENNEDIESGPYWVSGSQTILRVGESLSSFWGYERLGTWSTAEADEAAERGYLPGEAKRSVAKKILGKGLPDWTGSFINNFTYGNFDLSVNLQFVYGVDILQQFYHSTEDRSGIANGLRSILTKGWTPERQNTMVQEIRNQAYAGQNSEIDSHWLADGSYLRVNAITAGYNFSSDLLTRLHLKTLRVYASVQNAFVFHSKDFQGYDPEATSWSDQQWGQNMVFFQYPKPRTFTLGVNVKF